MLAKFLGHGALVFAGLKGPISQQTRKPLDELVMTNLPPGSALSRVIKEPFSSSEWKRTMVSFHWYVAGPQSFTAREHGFVKDLSIAMVSMS